jgi:hypothetical protein
MQNYRESPESVLGALRAEMAKPHVAASAQEAMHPESRRMERQLVLVDEGLFHGYACDWCGCRFPDGPEGDVPGRATPDEKLFLFAAQREKRFAEHVCADRPLSTH